MLEESGGRRKKKEEQVEGCTLRKFRTDYGYWFYSSNKKKFRKRSMGLAAAAHEELQLLAHVLGFSWFEHCGHLGNEILKGDQRLSAVEG